jgi:hypothetical protein
MRRRTADVLAGLGAVLALCGGGGVVATAVAWSRADLDTAGEVDFRNALAVPPLADSRIDREGRRVFDLRAQEGRTDLGRVSPPAPGASTATTSGPRCVPSAASGWW